MPSSGSPRDFALETPRETVIEKGAVLDVRARLYTSQLVRGDHCVELAPTVGVFLLSLDARPA